MLFYVVDSSWFHFMVPWALYGVLDSSWCHGIFMYHAFFMVSWNLYVPCILYGVMPLCIYVTFLNFVLFQSTSFFIFFFNLVLIN